MPFVAIIGAAYRRMWDYAVRRDAAAEDAVEEEEEYPVLNSVLAAPDEALTKLTSEHAPAAKGMMQRILGKPKKA